MTRPALGAAAVAVAALIAGCGGGGTGPSGPTASSAPQSSSAHASGSATPSASTLAPVEVTDAMGDQLCDAIKPQLSDWRVQGPTLGKVALNIAVHDWALRNGGLAMSMQVLGDKAMIDRVTTKRCSDVRNQALQALELPDLAAGIAF
jgi:hypothetical protein